jgi:ethanolamine utilization protein EutQ (cupin superfamily)
VSISTEDLTKRLLKTGMEKSVAEQKALEMSTEIMAFTNKAGAMIVSVAVEEMLHMSLSSNVKQALAGPPDLVDKSPSEWPAFVPGHDPHFPINRMCY